MNQSVSYTEDAIRSLDWCEHIRLRPGMYIGKLGDGTHSDDGIYVLIKEVIDNAVDEFVMHAGTEITVEVNAHSVRIRDYGRGIPLGKVIDCVAKINTGGKYDSKAFKKSVGLNGVGTKAVNALSTSFCVQSFRDGKTLRAEFSKGKLQKKTGQRATTEPNGTLIEFEPDPTIFKNYTFQESIVASQVRNYSYLNTGLALVLNGKRYVSKHGLLDLLTEKIGGAQLRYPIIHLKTDDLEIALTHGDAYGEDLYTFVNGQYTTMGGTHQAALREAIAKAVREHFKKDFEPQDIRSGIHAAIAVRIEDPVFESQTKTKLGSLTTGPDGPTIRSWVIDYLRTALDNWLHQHVSVGKAMLARIQQSERERKEMAGIRKLAQERAKKASVFNKKLRDCRVHRGSKNARAAESTLFITEGDSASGSMTKARDVQTQAVFSLRGKPLNSFGMTKKVVYENEEFNLLQHALDIESDIDNLRYGRIVIATDADVDGLHIRLLTMTFFLQFFPELVKRGHVFMLETPLFRVRDKKKTLYCFDANEKKKALDQLGSKAEITRFKGLGEISPDEFKQFIGPGMRLAPVTYAHQRSIEELLRYYMGKNTPDRQSFIVENLRIEGGIEPVEMQPKTSLPYARPLFR